MDFSVVSIKLMADIADLQNKMQAAQASVGGAMVNISNSIDGAKAAMVNFAKVAAVAFVTGKAMEQVKEMAMLNARYQELGVVMVVVGKNAGYNAVEMQNYATQVQKTGISMIESRNTVIQLSQAQINLADASKLARIAQDAAVIGNTNSSDALQAMIHGIKSAQVDVLRNIGINVSFEDSYKALAKTLGVSKESLSEHQKMLARENAVMEEGSKISGAYEAAMGTAGKQMRSMARYAEDLKVMRGEVFNEALTVGVMAFVDQLKEANAETTNLAENKALAQWGADIADALAFLGDSVASIFATFKALGDAIGWAGAQLALLRMPANTKEEMEAYWAARDAINEESKARQESYDKMGSMFATALAARRAAHIADTNARLDLEKEYARRALEVQVAYANQSIEVQRAAQIALAKNMMPAGMPDAPKIAAGSDDKAKALTEYQRLIKAIQEKTAADMLDMQTQGSLTAGQKETVKIMEDLRDGTLKLTQAQKAHLVVELERRLATEAQKIEEERAMKQTVADAASRQALRTKENDAIEAYMLAQEEARHKAEQGAKDQLKAVQDQYDQYGMTKSQIEALVIAELRLRQTRVTADSEEYASLQRQIETRQKLTTVIADTEERDRQKGMWESIEQNAHSTFSNVLQGGQDLWSKLRSSGQAIFVDWLYQLTLKRWIFNLSASTSGSSVANAAIPGMSGGSTLGTLGNAASAANGVGTLGGVGSAFGAFGGAFSSGMTLGGAGFGAGLEMMGSATGVSSFMAGAGQAAGSAFAAAGPWVLGAIAAKELMGYKVDSKGNGITATLGANGLPSGQVGAYNEFQQTGGLFGGGTTINRDWSVADKSVADYITNNVQAITSSNKAYANAIGLTSTTIDGFTKTIEVNLTGLDAAGQQAAINAELTKFGNDQAAAAYGDALKSVALSGETTAQTMQRLATDLTGANQVMGVLGYTLYDVSTAGAAAASGLVQAMGGLAQFQSQMNAYYQGYYSQEEQKANVVSSAQATLTAAGISGFTNEQISGASREQIRAVVEAYAANKDTVEGAAQFAAVVKVANQLAAVTPATKAIAEVPAAVVQAVKENSSSGGGGGGSAITSAANDIAQAMQAGANGIWDEVKRIHGLMDASGGAQGLADLQAQYATLTASARAGSSDAAKALPGIMQALLPLLDASARTREDMQWQRGQLAASLAATGSIISSQFGLSVPSLDGGTNNVPHDMLIMAHRGEAVVPQQYNHANAGGSDYSDLLAEMQGMRIELADAKRSLGKIAGSAELLAHLALQDDTIGPAPARAAL